MAHSNDLQVLPPSAGYGIVIGIGGIFALFMLGLTWLQNRYTTFSTQQAEEFNTASRSVKPGLISRHRFVVDLVRHTPHKLHLRIQLRRLRAHVVRRDGYPADPPLWAYCD
jgi:hypothetical protein